VKRENIHIMCKVGIDTSSGSFKSVKTKQGLIKQMEWILSCLQTSYIDIAVLNREDPNVPLEESITALHDLLQQGKCRHIGMSEFSAANIRRANKTAKIECVEMEYSLMSRDIEESIIPTCRELGIGIVAYSPLCRGLLTGDVKHKSSPRFEGDNLTTNLKLVSALNKIAERKKVSVGELTLAWVHHRGNDIFPIPGTTKLDNLNKNLTAVTIQLSKQDLDEIEQACPSHAVQGDRYPHMSMTYKSNKDQ